MDNKERLRYFMNNIADSYRSYSLWKMIKYSRSTEIVGQELAHKYVEIQKFYPEFFTTLERSCLTSFAVLVRQPFDKTRKSTSLYKVDQKKTEEFVADNEEVLSKIKDLRDKLFAHKQDDILNAGLLIPSISQLDDLYRKLFDFYNQLSRIESNSSAAFYMSQIIEETDAMLFDIYRGRKTKVLEGEIKWSWKENLKKASEELKLERPDKQ